MLPQKILDVVVHFLRKGSVMELYFSRSSDIILIRPQGLNIISITKVEDQIFFEFGPIKIDSGYLLNIKNNNRVSISKVKTLIILISILHDKKISANFLYMYYRVHLFLAEKTVLEVEENMVIFNEIKYNFLKSEDIICFEKLLDYLI